MFPQSSNPNRVDNRGDRNQKRKDRSQEESIESLQKQLKQSERTAESIQKEYDEYKKLHAEDLKIKLEEAELVHQKEFQEYKEQVLKDNCQKDTIIVNLKGTKKELSNIIRELELNLEDTERSLNLCSGVISEEIANLGEFLKKENPSDAFYNHKLNLVTPENWNIGFQAEAPQLSLFIDRILGSQLNYTQLNMTKFLILASILSTVHSTWRSCISLNILFEHKTVSHSDLAQHMFSAALPASMSPRQLENILDKFVEIEKQKFITVPRKGVLVCTFDNIQILDEGTSRAGKSSKGKKIEVSTARLVFNIFDLTDRFNDMQSDILLMPKYDMSHEDAILKFPDGYKLSNTPNPRNPDKLSEIQYLSNERHNNCDIALSTVIETDWENEVRGLEYKLLQSQGDQKDEQKKCSMCDYMNLNIKTKCGKCSYALPTMPQLREYSRQQALKKDPEKITRQREEVSYQWKDDEEGIKKVPIHTETSSLSASTESSTGYMNMAV